MNEHHFRFFLRQWIEHQNRANLRIHQVINGVSWLALTTLLSQVPTPLSPFDPLGSNLGAWFTAGAVVYWMLADPLVSLLVLAFTVGWASLPFAPWGPGHGWLVGVVGPVAVFTAMGLTALFAHIYYHEHAEFMNNDPKLRATLETTHAVFFGAFYFWLTGLIELGYRPALKRQLDAAERAALLRRRGVPWKNWGRTASGRPVVSCVPLTTQDMADMVREAAEEGRKVRVVGSGFTWSSFSATDEVLIFTERLDKIEVDASDPERPFAWVEAGVTNRQLNAELARHGLAMPWNVVLETVRVAAYVTLGTHGSGRETGTTGDLVEEFTVITSKGELATLSEATIGREGMSAARLSLGLFGVIARVKLRLVPSYRVLQVDKKVPVSQMLEQVEPLVKTHDSVELFWFPFNSGAWLRTLDRTGDPPRKSSHGLAFKALNFFHQGWLSAVPGLVERLAPGLTPSMLRLHYNMLTFEERVMPLSQAHHYRHWIELTRCGCVEVGFKVDAGFENVREAWKATERLVDEYAQRGKFPLNCAVNVRFTGPSTALLSAAYGEGITCYIEALCIGRSEGWEQFSAELCNIWLKTPGALPHWAKEFEHIPGVFALSRSRLGDRLGRFLAARDQAGVDPHGMFRNPVIDRLLTPPGAG